jgi:predicted deacylase
VLINALTHGNELCGMTAVTHLLDNGVRPLIGTLTLSFANVEAYESFDAAKPFDSRQIVHNMNRIWSSELLDGEGDSPELRRARLMRAVVDAADHVLDIHSTSQDVEPFWVYPAFARNAQVALNVGMPQIHLVMPKGLGSGTPLIQYGAFGEASHHGAAMVVECGQHFKTRTGEVALAATQGFLAHFGLIAPSVTEAQSPAPARRYELLQTCMV